MRQSVDSELLGSSTTRLHDDDRVHELIDVWRDGKYHPAARADAMRREGTTPRKYIRPTRLFENQIRTMLMRK